MEKKVYDEMYVLEERHWWFRGRRSIIFDFLEHVIPGAIERALDIGCGTGLNTRLLAGKARRAVGLESSNDAIRYTRERAPDVEILRGEFPMELPRETYSLVTLFDVLEHFDDDSAALKKIAGILTGGGHVMLTVPAFPFLWSEHDALAHHRRRYTKRTLCNALRAAGLEPVRASYYNFFLFPVVAAVRVAKKMLGLRTGATDFFMPPRALNAALAALFASERFLLRHIDLPFGVSLIAVARKSKA